jgi:hypothetical protein
LLLKLYINFDCLYICEKEDKPKLITGKIPDLEMQEALCEWIDCLKEKYLACHESTKHTTRKKIFL